MSALIWIACAAFVVYLMCGAVAAAPAMEDERFARPRDKDDPRDFVPRFADRAAWQRRAEFLRHQALVAQGLWPVPDRTPLNPVVHGTIERQGYTIEKVFFASMPGHYVSGNLYRPTGRAGKLPAVLAPYGHWPDGRFIWRSDADVQKELDSGSEVDPNAARTPLQANCAMLARMGCIVFHYDMVGYCDSQAIAHKFGFLDAESILRLQSTLGLQTWNSIRSLDFVLSLSDVDPARIGVSGSSSGGTQTIALDAVDPRPAAGFPMVMVSMNMQGGCICENAPLYRILTNNVELACLFAPKPHGAAAANDWTMDFETRGLPEMKAVWRLFGAEEEVTGKHIDFGHNHNLHSRLLQYAFFNKHLKLGWPEPVKELPFEPVHPKELSVYDAERPQPADAADAAELRRRMTKASDQALAAMSPEAYAATVRVALAAMVVEDGSAQVEYPQGGSGPMPSAKAGSWAGLISRRSAGERVPCKVVWPEQWQGAVVIWSHPQGTASLRPDDPAVARLLASGRAVVAVDLFMSGGFRPAPKAPAPVSKRPPANPPYAAFDLGYNRSILANRIHDLLTATAMVQSWGSARSVNLVAFAEAGPSAVLARALAGQSIGRAAIDLNEFDFDRVTSDDDPMMLPGALKYGGIYGFIPLCADRPTLLAHARRTGAFDRASRTPGVSLTDGRMGPERLVEWLLAG